jgi:hypothetical protein
MSFHEIAARFYLLFTRNHYLVKAGYAGSHENVLTGWGNFSTRQGYGRTYPPDWLGC